MENEALQNFDATAVSWITVCLEEGYSIALPTEASVYSGKIALRIPAGLHEDTAGLAAVDDCSVNQLLAVAISEYVGRRQGVPATQCLKRRITQHSKLDADMATK